MVDINWCTNDVRLGVASVHRPKPEISSLSISYIQSIVIFKS